MISVIKATEKNYKPIADIGRLAVEEAHRDSCPAADMTEYIDSHYSNDAIKEELCDTNNIYHVLNYNGDPVGFSKIVLNAEHLNIAQQNVTKLDRIYLLKEFHGLKLGFELLKFNIKVSRDNNQCGMWLFTWVGNTKAVDFYFKMGFTIIGSDNFKVSETHFNLQHQMFLNFSSFFDTI